MPDSDAQSENALLEIIFSPLPSVTEARPRQYANAFSPISVTVSGMTKSLESERQLWKAIAPIVTRFSGRVTLVRYEQL